MYKVLVIIRPLAITLISTGKIKHFFQFIINI